MKELWTDMDELAYQMGDMHGEAFQTEIVKPPKGPKPPKGGSKPISTPKPEVEKKHIKKTGK